MLSCNASNPPMVLNMLHELSPGVATNELRHGFNKVGTCCLVVDGGDEKKDSEWLCYPPSLPVSSQEYYAEHH